MKKTATALLMIVMLFSGSAFGQSEEDLVKKLANLVASLAADAAQNKPNIVIIWSDDIGQCNLDIYTRDMMGYTFESQ